MIHRLIFCFLLASATVYCQDNSDIRKGDECMKRGDYDRASGFYYHAAKGSTLMIANKRLAKALVSLGDYENAEMIYKTLASGSPDSAIEWFYYAQVLRRNGKYNEAGKAYQTYFKSRPADPLAEEFRDFETRVKLIPYDSIGYKLINIPENTSGSDVGPTFCYIDLCFSSNRGITGQAKQTYDLYIRHAGNPSNPAAPEKLKGDINGKLNEGPAAFSRNGREIIFTRSNYGHKGADGIMRTGLYHADYDSVSKNWINITPLGFIDYNFNFMQPSLSKDGSMLFFVSDMNSGLGETDIYVSYKHDNIWTKPANLGSGINTIGREETPYIADDGSLYFSSDSRMGLGGLDIYSAKLKDGVWGQAKNLGAPFNSSYNDFGYIKAPSGNTGYLVSNRPAGKGGNDIYQFISLTPGR